jgi:GntR family transcriptional regulator
MREELLAELLDGTYPSGVKLPNEDELAERSGVSRATVREAVGGLVEAGYLTRRHGSGTFVAGTLPRRHALDASVSYTSMIREAGMTPGLVILDRSEHEATAEEAELLQVPEGEPLQTVERTRTADGRPVVYSVDRLPRSFLPSDGANLDASLYDVLEQGGHPVRSASARLTPVTAEERLALLLEVEAGTPLLHIDQVDFDADGHPVMLSAEWHVADAFEMHINRRAAR